MIELATFYGIFLGVVVVVFGKKHQKIKYRRKRNPNLGS